MTLRLPDFADYLTPELAAREESGWAAAQYYRRNVVNIISAARMFSLRDDFRLLELCCGSGWVPTLLPESIRYLGVDANTSLLALAVEKNSPSREFTWSDVRTFVPPQFADLTACFAALKHFGLHEWMGIFRGMLRSGRYGVFNIQITNPGESSYDDGVDFHHTWIDEWTVRECLRLEGRSISGTDCLHVDAKGRDMIYFTRPETA